MWQINILIELFLFWFKFEKESLTLCITLCIFNALSLLQCWSLMQKLRATLVQQYNLFPLLEHMSNCFINNPMIAIFIKRGIYIQQLTCLNWKCFLYLALPVSLAKLFTNFSYRHSRAIKLACGCMKWNWNKGVQMSIEVMNADRH